MDEESEKEFITSFVKNDNLYDSEIILQYEFFLIFKLKYLNTSVEFFHGVLGGSLLRFTPLAFVQ